MRGLLVVLLAAAFPCAVHAKDDALHHFRVGKEPVNPACIVRMKPLMSDNAPIILSISVDACQHSNWAAIEGKISEEDNVVSATVDERIENYRVLGVSPRGEHILLHDGVIGIYRLDKNTRRTALTKPDFKDTMTLSLVASEFVPCFKGSEVKGKRLVVEKQVYDAAAPRAQQCTDKLETVSFVLD